MATIDEIRAAFQAALLKEPLIGAVYTDGPLGPPALRPINEARIVTALFGRRRRASVMAKLRAARKRS